MLRSKTNRLTLSLLLVTALFIIASCDSGGKVRKYKEEKPTPAATPRAEAVNPHAGASHFQWQTPEGWTEENKKSSLRLATFTIKSGDKEALCTVVPLRGEAGGLKANVLRWLDQLNIPMAPESEALKQFLDKGEKFLAGEKYPAVFLDFTTLTPEPGSPSMLVGVITVGGSTVFVKMTGPRALLQENIDKFKTFCRSFSGAIGK